MTSKDATTEVHALLQARNMDDPKASYGALIRLFEMSEKPVDWAYDIWDSLVDQLRNGDNHERAFSAQMLSRLAISDPEERILRILPVLEAVMRDERFVTARHTVQSIWRAGVPGKKHAERVAAALAKRYGDCTDHKNAALIRTDIIGSLRNLADTIGREQVEPTITKLLAKETDAKAKKKQQAVWNQIDRTPHAIRPASLST